MFCCDSPECVTYVRRRRRRGGLRGLVGTRSRRGGARVGTSNNNHNNIVKIITRENTWETDVGDGYTRGPAGRDHSGRAARATIPGGAYDTRALVPGERARTRYRGSRRRCAPKSSIPVPPVCSYARFDTVIEECTILYGDEHTGVYARRDGHCDARADRSTTCNVSVYCGA